MGKHPITAFVAAAAVLAAGAFVSPIHAGDAPEAAALTFYGAEMKREPEITLKEFNSYARSHGQADFVISKSALVTYEGDGDVILAALETDQAAAQKAADELPGKGKVLAINVLPSALSTKKGVAVYKLPLLVTEDGRMGDVWVKAGSNAPQQIAKNVVLNSTKANVANLFKFVGFADKETALAYCLDDCTRYDLVSGQKSALTATKGEDAAGIRRSIDNLLTKEDAEVCKNKMSSDQILNVDKEGFYRGVCPAKGNQVLQVQLKKDSGRWKIINSDWQKPQAAPK